MIDDIVSDTGQVDCDGNSEGLEDSWVTDAGELQDLGTPDSSKSETSPPSQNIARADDASEQATLTQQKR